jgi:hypothetical protein
MGRRVEAIGPAIGLALVVAGGSLAAQPPVKPVAVRTLRGRLAGWKKVSSDSDAASECAFS